MYLYIHKPPNETSTLSDELRKSRDETLHQILSALINQGLNGTQVARLVERPTLYVLGFLDGLVAAGLLKVHQEGRSNVFEIDATELRGSTISE